MPKEPLITDTIVERVPLDWRGQDPSLTGYASLQAVTAILAQLASLPSGKVFIIYGDAHELVPPHPANPGQGTRWFPDLSEGGMLNLVLARVDEPAQQVHIEYEAYKQQGEIGVDEPTSWLGVGFNPTTIPTGNNVLPVTIADPATGEFDEVPSSSPRLLTAAYRMGLHLLPELARQAGLTNGDLFSDRTLQAIKDGDVHVTRSQWAAYLPADVLVFLQLLVVLYDQTIAHKSEIIQLAKHLGFTFSRFPKTGPLTGVMLEKYQGNKKQYSITFYNKAAEVARMRQGRTLTRREATIVRDYVRLDVTVHSAGALTFAGEAQRRLPQLLKRWPKYLDAASAQRFLNEQPLSQVWWLERTVGILSHTTTDFSRQSFGSWLIPKMLREVLKLNTIAGFTAADLDVMLRQDQPVVAAWCKTEQAEDDWAGALAQAVGCSKGWVYAQRKSLLAQYHIDIALPFAFYRDLVFFGPNSLTKPKVRAALNAALARGDAATNLRLRQKAVTDFDRRRITVVGGTVRSPPLLMSPKVAIDRAVGQRDRPEVQSAPLVNRPGTTEVALKHTAPPELDEFDDLPVDFEDVDLDEAVPVRPAPARPMAKEFATKVRMRGLYSKPPPPAQKKLTFQVRRSPPPKKKIILWARPSPPLPPEKEVIVSAGITTRPATKSLGHPDR
jgi:hypothetical protein